MKISKCKECGSIVSYKNDKPYSMEYTANYWCDGCKEWKFPHNVVEV